MYELSQRHKMLADTFLFYSSFDRSIGPNFLLALSNNFALAIPIFSAFLNDLGHEQKMRSGQTPKHVTLGPESAVEVHTPGGP